MVVTLVQLRRIDELKNPKWKHTRTWLEVRETICGSRGTAATFAVRKVDNRRIKWKRAKLGHGIPARNVLFFYPQEDQSSRRMNDGASWRRSRVNGTSFTAYSLRKRYKGTCNGRGEVSQSLVIFLRVFGFVRSFMELVRLTTFINLFPEKIAGQCGSVCEISISCLHRHFVPADKLSSLLHSV